MARLNGAYEKYDSGKGLEKLHYCFKEVMFIIPTLFPPWLLMTKFLH